MNVEISLSDLDLPFPQSGVMDYETAPAVRVADKLVMGYLSPDDHCENPLTNWCGYGQVFSSHRSDGREAHEGMQDALALDREWSPDIELCYAFEKPFRQSWIEAAANSAEFQAWADQQAGPEAQLSESTYLALAKKFWRRVGLESQSYGVDDIWDFSFTEDVRHQLWARLREEGKIGDPDAVLLDCYDHGGRVWSISGGGMQCQFDTAKGAGVWVPDDSAREEILRRAKVYAFGRIQTNGAWTVGSGRKRYWAVKDEAFGGHSEEFREWHQAYEWLEKAVKRLKKRATKAQLTQGRRRAAHEIAATALSLYNDWLSGNCYGVVVCVYENVAASDEEPEWELLSSDDCWGYIGSDDTMAVLREQVQHEAQRLIQPPAAVATPLEPQPHYY